VDERREPPPPPVTRPPVITSAAGNLSPLQQAYSHYVTHTTNCDVCRDIDCSPCKESERLWNAYQERGDEAYRRLSEEA
jgi:hypothetical protein